MNCINKEKCMNSYDSNIIWCNNTGVTGEKYYYIFFSIGIITLPYILLLIIIILNKGNIILTYPLIISSILFIIEVSAIIKTACTDPGIMHKHERNNKYKLRKYFIKSIINGHLYELSFCQSCFLFNPPRAKHCYFCDNCVLRFDHHCNWVGHCIGQKNYSSFFILIWSIFFSNLFYIIYPLYYICVQAKKFKNKENYNKLILWGFSIVVLYNILMLFTFIGRLVVLHTYLQCINKTFYEYLKNKFTVFHGNIS